MSSTTISDMTFSKILSQIGKFEIGLNCSTFSVGITLATGVINSILYLAGQEPVLRLVLIIWASGSQKNKENLLKILAGISPGRVALLVFIWLMNI